MATTEFYSLPHAAKLFKVGDGKTLHPSTLYRWCTKGVDGVFLEFERMGRRIYTTSDNMYRFSAELKEKQKNKDQKPTKKKSKDKDERHKKILKKYGLKS